MSNWSKNLYLLNFALLFTHKIDSAYWHEWDFFGYTWRHPGLPGAELAVAAGSPLRLPASPAWRKKWPYLRVAVSSIWRLCLLHPYLLHPGRTPRVHAACFADLARLDPGRIAGPTGWSAQAGSVENMPHTIIHLDLDAFFCAVKEQDAPSHRGVVSSSGSRLVR